VIAMRGLVRPQVATRREEAGWAVRLELH
jgi:hypothetical protein